jgi:hypothetical protein
MKRQRRSQTSPTLLPLGSGGDPKEPEELIYRLKLLARLGHQGGAWPHAIEPRRYPEWLANFIVTPEKRRFTFDGRPWLHEIAVASVTVKEMVQRKASQVGATVLNLSSAYYLAARRFFQAGVAYFFPTDNDLKDLSNTKAQPLIDNSYLADLTESDEQRVGLKKINGVWIYFRGTSSTIRMKAFSVDMVVIDEADEIPQEAQKMAEQRMHASPLQWLRHFSKPSIPSYGIDRSFLASDQRFWTIRCNGCRHEFAFEDKGVFPECVGFSKGEAFRCCPKCKHEVFLDDGRWMPRNPGAKAQGYQLSQMLSPIIDPGDLVRDLQSTERVAEFWRGRMGVPYAESEGKVDESQVTDLCGNVPRVNSCAVETCFGVDVGRVFHWWAIGRPRGGTLRTVGLGEALTPEALIETARAMKCQRMVIDALPETHLVTKIQGALPGKVWACYYSKQTPVPAVWNPDPLAPMGDVKFWRVDCSRTLQLDRLLNVIRDGQRGMVLPQHDAVVEEAARHIANVVRVSATDEETGAKTYRYVQTGPDHYAHAANYALLAASGFLGPARSLIFGPA